MFKKLKNFDGYDQLDYFDKIVYRQAVNQKNLNDSYTMGVFMVWLGTSFGVILCTLLSNIAEHNNVKKLEAHITNTNLNEEN